MEFGQVFNHRIVKAAQDVIKMITMRRSHKAFLTNLDSIRVLYPENRCAQYMTRELFLSYTRAQRETLYRCCISSLEYPNSSVGCYLMDADNLRTYSKFFDPLIRDLHSAGLQDRHVTNWDISEVGNQGTLDLSAFGVTESSMRIRVCRNLKRFKLQGSMSLTERIKLEKFMLSVFKALQRISSFGGQVYSLTPDFGRSIQNPNRISPAQYQQLVQEHLMFKNMDFDPYLKSAGLSADWPYGRGCYVSADKHVIIWLGEEDHLRIMCMKRGTKFHEVFNRLQEVLYVIEHILGLEFAIDNNFGYITSCPSNLGTGMRASVHLKIPHLTHGNSDTEFKNICEALGLAVRGVNGEHTPIGDDGTVDISPSARLFISERDIVAKLYKGIQTLMSMERAVAYKEKKDQQVFM